MQGIAHLAGAKNLHCNINFLQSAVFLCHISLMAQRTLRSFRWKAIGWLLGRSRMRWPIGVTGQKHKHFRLEETRSLLYCTKMRLPIGVRVKTLETLRLRAIRSLLYSQR